MKTSETRKLLGYVDVDSGSIFIGDPCYLVKEEDWKKFSKPYIDALNKGEVYAPIPHKKGHPGMGIVSGTLYGDGTYPVYAEFAKNGGIKSLTINFEDEYEDEDEDGY